MKDLDNPEVMAKAEMGFIKVIVLPLWTELNKILSGDVNIAVERLKKNQLEWENIAQELFRGSFDLKLGQYTYISQSFFNEKHIEKPELKTYSVTRSIFLFIFSVGKIVRNMKFFINPTCNQFY